MRSINFLVKLSISTGIIIFALFYELVWYNLFAILFLILLIRRQHIRIIRFRSVSKALIIFLVLIFFFKSLTGYGKILLYITDTIKITTGGIHQAILVTTNIILIFLLTGISLYSSSRKEILYYIGKISGKKSYNNFGARFGKICLLVLDLLPEIFSTGIMAGKDLRKSSQTQHSLRARFDIFIIAMQNFVVNVLRKAEKRSPEYFSINYLEGYIPMPVINFRHFLFISLSFGLHGTLIWVRYA